jgi:cytoskeletal protein RodZ
LLLRKKEKEMKIHLKKVLVSLLVIFGFVFYAIYQRYFIAQQAIITDPSLDTVADQNTSETVTTTTVSQAETVPPTNPPETTAGNVISGDDGEYGDDDEAAVCSKQHNLHPARQHQAALLQQPLPQLQPAQLLLQHLRAPLLQLLRQLQLPQMRFIKMASTMEMPQMLITALFR